MSTSDILESLIEKDNGYLITSKAVESGVSKPSVSKYVREHDMEKVAHGIYILDDVWPDELFVLQQRNKNIIYSGETALYLHGLIDRESRYDFQPFAFQSIAQSSYPAEQVDYPYSILFRHIVHSSFKVSIFVQR